MMTGLNSDSTDHVEHFFRHIDPWIRAFRGRTFHYFGVVSGNEIHLCAARIRLQVRRPSAPRQIATGRFRAGVITMPGVQNRAKEIVKALVSGTAVSICSGLAVRLPTSNGSGMHVAPPALIHPEGLSAGRRLGVLTIQAGQWPITEGRPDVDWSFKSASEPYDNLAELFAEFGLADHGWQRCTLEVVAFPPVEVSTRSVVAREHASIGIQIPKGLPRNLASLQYRVLTRDRPTTRASLSARQLKWEADGDGVIGTADIGVPRGAVVNCVASYASVAHHSHWLADPTLIPNPRVQALTAIEGALEALRATLTNDSTPKGAAAKQFETAVAAIAWAYGLAPAQTEYAEQTRDGPDVLAVAPSGGIAVIECTIGLLKAQNKLANLAMRAVAIRERMQAAASVPPTVLPVIVTRFRRADVEAELDAATDAGVLVIARENLEGAMNEMLLLQDGDAIFRRGLQALARAKADLAAKRGQTPNDG